MLQTFLVSSSKLSSIDICSFFAQFYVVFNGFRRKITIIIYNSSEKVNKKVDTIGINIMKTKQNKDLPLHN